MAAALRAAEGGGVYFFQILRGGGYFQNFSGQGGYTPLPPYSRPLLFTQWLIEINIFRPRFHRLRPHRLRPHGLRLSGSKAGGSNEIIYSSMSRKNCKLMFCFAKVKCNCSYETFTLYQYISICPYSWWGNLIAVIKFRS